MEPTEQAIVDSYGRRFRYLRVSATDRCNLRCRYCMPAEGIRLLRHEDIITYEEIAAVARAAASLGVTSVRITGGEPLVRRGITSLVSLLSEIEGLNDISMTTNGLLLAGIARALADAGLGRVNVSIDSLDPAEYLALTRGGDLTAALAGVEAALEAGLHPLKVNAVMLDRTGDDLRRWVESFVALARRLPVHVRFIEVMPLNGARLTSGSGRRAAEIIRALGGAPASGPGVGAGPARYWRLDGVRGSAGLIAPMSDPFCGACNRLRLTARGELRPCLFSAPDVDLIPLLRPRVVPVALAEALSRAWSNKPLARQSLAPGAVPRVSMCQIGG